jgi:Flp pilus assembly protein TadD
VEQLAAPWFRPTRHRCVSPASAQLLAHTPAHPPPTAKIAIGIGDVAWAQQCFRLVVSLEPGHAEAWNNLAVLEQRRGDAAQVGVRASRRAPAVGAAGRQEGANGAAFHVTGLHAG